MFKIVHIPNKVLETPTKKVEKIDEKIKYIVDKMKKTLLMQKDPPGVGLAANQVGISLSIFLIRPNINNEEIEVFINPKILEKKDYHYQNKKKKSLVKLEGCLSIPKIWGPVKRAKKVLVEYENLDGKKIIKWFSGFKAVIIQHEMDHLNGIVFTQRTLEQKLKLYKEKGDSLVEMEI